MIRFRSLAAVLAILATAALTSTPASAKRVHHHRAHVIDANGNDGERIVSHPSGCPGRVFCGCGVSVRVFGRPVRELFLASNWGRFPRAIAAAGMVAYRNHHVFYIESMIDGSTAMAYDPNSGGHATRIHPRSISGYRIVNPNGSHMATL
jgi:hypothetical protein